MKMVKVILSFSILFSFISCEKKEELIGRFEMLKLAQKINPTVKPVLAEDLNSGPRCKGKDGTLFYGKGCIRAIPVQVGILNMICDFDEELIRYRLYRIVTTIVYLLWTPSNCVSINCGAFL